ncbi:hypothetical protein [Nevskia sp.]|uniref:hypothetical protein n=1 Tax=Nevskia sp. TaxID=1929292 RepID=UPI0025D161E5|nr:hypothetical protein [Nevskia sp.]
MLPPKHLDSTSDTALAAALTVASLLLWFGLGFPWAHHNESLVWIADMAGRPLADAFSAYPIRPVQSWRPLGVAEAWFGWAATGDIWLQQLLNFLVTAAAWWLALRATAARMAFGFAALVTLAGFFSPYIYLFHLHGVFYGPLLLFQAWLLVRERQPIDLGWRATAVVFTAGAVAMLFHTFGFLFYAAFLGAAWLEASWRGRRIAPLLPTLAAMAIGVVFVKLSVAASTDIGTADVLLGLLTSYRALELNALLSGLAAALAIIAAVVAGLGSGRSRIVLFAALAAALSLALFAAGLPVVLGWIAITALRALAGLRLRMAALIGLGALLPAATSTGSPTYTVFVVMPCLLMTVDGLIAPASWRMRLRGLAIAALSATAALLLLLRLGVPVPIVDKLAQPLRAEGEKTHQLRAALEWLLAQPDARGQTLMCTSAEFPIRAGHPLDRHYRAPTGDWVLAQYLLQRTGERLGVSTGTLYKLCFGDQVPDEAGAERLQAWPGRWAGEAAWYRLPPS